MFTAEEITSVKNEIPKSISYPKIAEATGGKVSHSDVKKFYAFKSVPFDKALIIVETTRKLIKDQEEQKAAALAS